MTQPDSPNNAERMISAHYDAEADAMQIALQQVTRVDRTIEAVPGVVNLDMKGDEVVGVEILHPRQPLWLAKVAAEYGFAGLLDDIYAVTATVLGCTISGPASFTVIEAWRRVA